MSREITNAKFRKLMNRAGLDDVHLYKENGYFWISCDTDRMMRTTSICVYSFTMQTPEKWVEDIKQLIEQE